MSCGYQLKWYDLVPLFSWIFLGGKCRKCKERISIQYPIIEFANGALYVLIFIVNGINAVSILYALMASALLALSVIDFRTYEIPVGFNIFIAVLGIVRIILDYEHWYVYVIGCVSVGLVLWLIYQLSGGRAIGGGDVKLMAAAGLVIGWKANVLAFFVACIGGSIIHIIRMKVSGAEKVLAMGPYLSAGILLSALWGNQLVDWYLKTFFM
jgi:leader peptidase (prepilin peptidase)/N-methyltransferase